MKACMHPWVTFGVLHRLARGSLSDSRAARTFVTGDPSFIIITAPNFVPSFVSSARLYDAGLKRCVLSLVTGYCAS